ncbi:hypothetical protein MD484_g7856, partial [Candolleomyces efflorescens]
MSSATTRQRAVSFSEVLTSEKTRALVYLLNSIDATTFVQRLLDTTKPENGYTTEEIEALTEALKGVGFERVLAQAERAVADDTLRHCLRCHHSYLERENKNDACVIRHAYPFSMALPCSSQDAHQQCLGCEKSVPTASVVDQVCVATRHTTNAANLLSIRNSKLIRTCDEAGCYNLDKPVKLKQGGDGRAWAKLPAPFSFASTVTPTKPVVTPSKGPESWTLVASSSVSSNASEGSEDATKGSKPSFGTAAAATTNSSDSKAEPAVISGAKSTPTATHTKSTIPSQAPPNTNGSATGCVAPPPFGAPSTTKVATATPASIPPSGSSASAASFPNVTFASLMASSGSSTAAASTVAPSTGVGAAATAPLLSSSNGLFSFGMGPLSTAMPKAPASASSSPVKSGGRKSAGGAASAPNGTLKARAG